MSTLQGASPHIVPPPRAVGRCDRADAIEPTVAADAGTNLWPLFSGAGVPRPETPRRRRELQAIAVFGLLLSTLYLVWRVVATLNGAALWLAVPLVVLELHALVSLTLFVFGMWDVDVLPPRPEWSGRHRIAVLIPTYSEPREVLLPTLAAAAAMRPSHETWVLDDGDRTWVADLAAELGLRYVTRPTHEHAKAGNLNHALTLLREAEIDLIAVLDADHVARAEFLEHTLGYFEDPRVALVQTPQGFYNADSFEHVHRRVRRRSRGAAVVGTPAGDRPGIVGEDVRFFEQELFYRGLAAGRNRTGSAFWCGTGAVLRRAALDSVGGVATGSVTEDIATTMLLHARGWKSVYHNEVLARGLAATNAGQYLGQRLRWGTGAMQVLRSMLPMAWSGLTRNQRVAYLATLTGWFDSWRTFGYLVAPPLAVLTGALPMVAPLHLFLPLFSATFLAQRLALHRLSRGHATVVHATLFEVIRLPATLRATLALFTTKEVPFHVTPKGAEGEHRSRLKAPVLLVGLAVAGAATVPWFVAVCLGFLPMHYGSVSAAALSVGWAVANTAMVIAAIRRIRAEEFGTDRRNSVRFAVDLPGQMDRIRVTVRDISLTGALVSCPASEVPAVGTGVTLAVLAITKKAEVVKGAIPAAEHGEAIPIVLSALVRSVHTGTGSGQVAVGLEFVGDALERQPTLALALFGTGISPSVVFA